MTAETNPSQAYDLMQEARRVAKEQSCHPNNPIGSVLRLQNGYVVSSANLFLQKVAPDFDKDIKVGRSSPSKHSEPSVVSVAAQHGFSTDGADLYITDPLCPNCMGAIVCAGIKSIYIDAYAFDGGSEWYKRRARHFDVVSLQIASNAGVSVFKSDLDDQHKTLCNQALSLPAPTKIIDFDDGSYEIEYIAMTNFDLNDYKSLLRQYFQEKKKLGKKNKIHLSGGGGWVVIAIPPAADRNEFTIVKAATKNMIDRNDKSTLLTQSDKWDDLDEQQKINAIEKYKSNVYPLAYARSICGRFGIPMREGTHILTSKNPTSHEIVGLCDVMQYVQLHILDKRSAWMPTDKKALEMLQDGGADLLLPPDQRHVNDVINVGHVHVIGDDTDDCECC